MLTVLFVIGLSAGLVIPNLPLVFDRISFALERDTVVRTLNALPYRAFEQNQDLVFMGEHDWSTGSSSDGTLGNVIDMNELGLSTPFRSARVQVASIVLPDDWFVSVADPIIYRSSGFCTGGDVVIGIGQIRYVLSAKAPYCQFSEEQP